MGHFIEVQVSDGALYRTKIHCYFLDQTRVVRPLHKEKNYHIFYQMLAGLTPDERAKLNLEGYSVHNLRYLNCGDVSQDKNEDRRRFEAWKTCLGPNEQRSPGESFVLSLTPLLTLCTVIELL
ncbi:unnamed protein product [Notodromas monacha]|uniref:Myosin motor domain-containing protein n=1 Tax=Notodromas monacha TaxID=399045 RepID=A0A7R9BXB2_9CRUS|nr:unnamed protein product [Notodromas monacha]CAG0923088.1 unnamed protein product [Notodromas monacha]